MGLREAGQPDGLWNEAFGLLRTSCDREALAVGTRGCGSQSSMIGAEGKWQMGLLRPVSPLCCSTTKTSVLPRNALLLKEKGWRFTPRFGGGRHEKASWTRKISRIKKK